MNFLGNALAFLTIAVLVLLSMLLEKNMNLKEEMKKNYNLVDENYNLKKKIDGLKEVVMEFKAGELTKGELVKSVQLLIDNEENEILKRLKKITQGEKEL